MKKKIRLGATGRGGIEVFVIEDSTHPYFFGRRLITLQLRYPRFIHAEFMTHRVFSRNASSSRAIPVAKMIEQVRTNPAVPFHWGQNEPGMQAWSELPPHDARDAEVYWRESASRAADMAEQMHKLGLHKQIANRVLEPYLFMSVVMTATEFDGFWELRDHPDAEPHIQELAKTMRKAIDLSTPTVLSFGKWHLPYVTAEERKKHPVELLRKLSAARCARVSYLTHDGAAPVIEKDVELFEKLVGSKPLHASPIEHQATPFNMEDLMDIQDNKLLQGNFKEWIQYRKVWERKLSGQLFPEILLSESEQEDNTVSV